ncbi:hypothetical protein TRFO_32642 [Tritrichomonas foetus]|uniref:Centrosomal protein of 76 kDa C-terminal domain-containing protein n=1 Tax=Tritrichomonas foetus TaxID=1144522 RepID=A0A1J4JQH5_9EUKA|nr:hypothetical protein TRFO_32642 [Tritrichomonas foetus]|eukprot:OHT00664.1 hypothetical protein TRFO_32642 [Tritrichomonas foetus]
MELQANVDGESKLRIRKFFEKQDAREYIRAFVSKQLTAGKIDETPQMPSLFTPMSTKPKPNPLQTEDDAPLVPSLRIDLLKGAAFSEFEGFNTKATLCFDLDVFGKRHRFDGITACLCPTLGKVITAPLPDKLEVLPKYNRPIRIVVSTTSPEVQFLGLASFEWRKVLNEGHLEGQIDIIGMQNEIVGVINYEMKLRGISKEINYPMFKEVLELQLKQEGIDSVDSERQFAINLRSWWRELTQLIDDKKLVINANEIGTGKTSIFSFITPMHARDLVSIGHCLRFAHLHNDLKAPINASFIPNWAAIASRCAGEREKLNILVSLLRGYGLRAFVVVGKPRCFAVSLSSSTLCFDIRSGKFGTAVPKGIENIMYIYNEEILLANLCPSEAKIDWDIDNPLKWKALKAPEEFLHPIPATIKYDVEHINEELLESKVKQIIEAHRQSVGLKTKWNTELQPLMLPIIDSYEHEKLTGSTLGVHTFASEAIQKKIKPYHAIRAAPASTNSANPGMIFKALTRTKCGLEIMGSHDDDASFVLIVRCYKYPSGIVSTWALIAIDSVTPLHNSKK